MNDFFELIGKIVTAVGGTGVIMISISSYFGKIWAEKYMENQRKIQEKELEEYKAKLNAELDRLRLLSDQAIMRGKILFEKEFDSYKKVLPVLCDIEESTEKLQITFVVYGSKFGGKKFFLDELEKALDNFSKIGCISRKEYNRYGVFIKQSIHEKIQECFSIMDEIVIIVNYEITITTQKAEGAESWYTDCVEKLIKLKQKKEEVICDIREHLKEVSMI